MGVNDIPINVSFSCSSSAMGAAEVQLPVQVPSLWEKVPSQERFSLDVRELGRTCDATGILQCLCDRDGSSKADTGVS